MPRRAAVLALLVFTACPRAVGPRHTELLVIAPHPDDEVLMAGGLMAQTIARGGAVTVVLVTNGDATCERDAAVREGESVAALTSLGVTEVRFLGFPDGALKLLGPAPLAPRAHRWPDGTCGALDETWADGRRGFMDEPRKRTGRSSKWTAQALEDELTIVLTELAPREVVVPHGIDDHADHAMTYTFFRRALDRSSTAPSTIRRAVVHAGPTWPQEGVAFRPARPMPPLPEPLAGYLPTDRLLIDARAKLEALGHYRSQLDGALNDDWLASFATVDEVFFSERLVRAGSRWVQAGSIPASNDARDWLTGGYLETNTWGPAGFMGASVRPSSSR
jgi:LmbE family N-acetylglucosaminyl deacetylase